MLSLKENGNCDQKMLLIKIFLYYSIILVVEDKVRPQLKTGSKSWRVRTGSNMDTLCDTIEDLWEHEEGCRIASATLVARIRSLQHRAHITG